jgi:hypothetical protein
MGRNLACIGAGIAVAYAALMFLLLGLRDFLTAAIIQAGGDPDVAPWLSSLLVAIVIGSVGFILIHKGKKALAREGLLPKKTVESLRKDQQFIKQKLAHP